MNNDAFSKRKKRLEHIIIHRTAEFLNKEAGRRSLITVTACHLNENITKAVIFLSVYPVEDLGSALAFARRKARVINNYIKETGNLDRVPKLEILPTEDSLTK
ncbi:MAG: hypothetical protein ACOCU8_01540 [Patescibacteria group bacterium]